MVSIAFYGGIPGGISTPITQQPKEVNTPDEDNKVFQPYCYIDNSKGKMAEGRNPRDQEEKNLKEEPKEEYKEEKGRNDWWKIGMFLLCLMGTTGGILWWYEGVAHPWYIGLVAVGGRLNGSSLSNVIECWGSFPGCRPFTNYFSYETNRTIYVGNDTATLLHAYQREITYIYKTSCVDSDHCQEYKCKNITITDITFNTTGKIHNFQKFPWLECNQTENAKTIVVLAEEMVSTGNNTWIPKGCDDTWVQVKHCPVDLLYGIHPIRLCVQPPFFLTNYSNNNTGPNSNNNTVISNCGPIIRLGILEDNKGVINKNGSCGVIRETFNKSDYSGIYQVPILYECKFNISTCNSEFVSVIMHETNNVQYLLCKNSTSGNDETHYCVGQTFGVIGQAHLELPRKNKRIRAPKFTHYNCSINNKTELNNWKLVKTSGITPIPISSEANTGLIRHKRDFGLTAIVAAIVAATAIAASGTMSYIALTEANKLREVQNHTFEVENNTIASTELIEKQIHILYAMILQIHADVQILKEKQHIEETFNLVGCIEQTHTFCHTGHPWNSTWGHLNDTVQWDDWVSQMERYNQDILVTLHAARNNLAQAMITFNTPDTIAQFGRNIWDHVANWIPGLGASIIKYIVMFLLIYLLLTSTPKIFRALWTVISGAGSSANLYLKRRYHHKRVWQEEHLDQGQYKVHLAGVSDGLEDKYKLQKRSRNNWNGESKAFNRQLMSYEEEIEASGQNYSGLKVRGAITHPGTITNAKKKIAGENPHQGSLNLEIQSDGGNIYDCCIKAQEGTLAIPCCGFPLWLFWGLLIVLGRIIGYALRGLATILTICAKGFMILFESVRKIFDYVGKALNPARQRVSMPQYI
uniref:Envelope glycoprotein n=1 Tax=Equine infectious anemia virus TaxID=11665 RepID=A0A6B9PWT4_9RETR|nr:envelope glycoprotein [Equine infectious anemia virus]